MDFILLPLSPNFVQVTTPPPSNEKFLVNHKHLQSEYVQLRQTCQHLSISIPTSKRIQIKTPSRDFFHPLRGEKCNQKTREVFDTVQNAKHIHKLRYPPVHYNTGYMIRRPTTCGRFLFYPPLPVTNEVYISIPLLLIPSGVSIAWIQLTPTMGHVWC